MVQGTFGKMISAILQMVQAGGILQNGAGFKLHMV